MRRILLIKKAYCALACLIMFQSVPLRADIKNSVSTIVNQLRESFVTSDLFNDKQLLAAIAFFSVCMGYSWYLRNRGSKNKTAPSSEEYSILAQKDSILEKENASLEKEDSSSEKVREVEEILKLKKISVTGSYGDMGPDLLIRAEAINRVLCANLGTSYVTLGQNQQETMNQLLQDPRVKTGLIRNQEERLRKELENSGTIWGLNAYAKIARKRLGLGKLTKISNGISSDVSNPQKKEAYEKLDTKGRLEVAFQAFTKNMIISDSGLKYWQENSILFKEPLKQILADLPTKNK